MKKIFISYASEDRSKAKSLASKLEQYGYQIWWDRKLIGGHIFRDEIQSQIDQADKVVVLWSNYSVRKPFVIDEAHIANLAKKLIPVRTGAPNPPIGFGHLHLLEYHELLDDLTPLIAAIEAKPLPPPPTPPRNGRWVQRLALPVGLAICIVGVVVAISVRKPMSSLPKCDVSDIEPRLDFKCFRSTVMKVEFIYPMAELTVDTEKQDENIISMFNLEKEVEVLITRKVPEHRDVRKARDDERRDLISRGFHVNFSYPQPGEAWSNWYMLTGHNRLTLEEFYYKRWFTERDVVSIEYNYKKERVRTYNEIIKHMVYGKFRFE